MPSNRPTSARSIYYLLIAGAVLIAGCGGTRTVPEKGKSETDGGARKIAKITLTTSAFANGRAIPKKYTADGDDSSPPLNWTGLPNGTKELVLICDDPDVAKPEPWVHWVVYNMTSDNVNLSEGFPPVEQVQSPGGFILQGQNSFARNNIGYRGPDPPPGSGPHHYHFKLYALSGALRLKQKATKDEIEAAMEGRVIGFGELIGTYER